MIIKKFQGKTKEDTLEKVREELGEKAVVMNVKEVRPKGIFSSFRKSTYEITAALEEKDTFAEQVGAYRGNVTMPNQRESINIAANEPIKIPPVNANEPIDQAQAEQNAIEFLKRNASLLKKEETGKADRIEEKLENLQNIIEKQLSSDTALKEDAKNFEKSETKKNENLAFLKVLYETLIENEVHEKYVNQILDELEKINWNGNSVDHILSNVYQKMILKFGQSHGVELSGSRPKIVFFVGPTGVGKTTTIAKLASNLKVNQGKRIAFLTADTYRIAAAEQLRTYANILDTPLSIIYSPDELNQTIERLEDYDVILVDTAGFSHKNKEQKEDVKLLLEQLDPRYDSEVYLVLSATTKYKDLMEICDVYHVITKYKIIFTKLDETTSYGNILNVRLYSDSEISYITNGQNVPDDIELFNSQKIVKWLLGGR